MEQELTAPAPAQARASNRFLEGELEEIRRSFVERLRTAFDQATNAEIARRLKTTDATIKSYTDAKRLPIAEMLLEIHRTTGINLHWLLTGQGPRRVSVNKLFNDREEDEIQQLARDAGRSYEEELHALVLAAMEFRNKI